MFQPAIPISGLAGWRFLQRTYDTQFDAFNKSPALQRDTDYFRENIGSISSAEELVSDRRLLKVALGAFGLQDDLDNKFFIKKMLEEGTLNDDSLANRFVDPRYKEFSKAFGFGPGEIPQNLILGFEDNIISKYERQSFEVAVGEQDQTLRIALTAERELAKMAGEENSVRQNWFTIMGQPAMRELFQTALGLPSAFSQVDIDQQESVFEERSLAAFGTANPADFADPELQDRLLSRFTALSQIANGSSATSSAAVALTLLGGA